MEAMEELCFLDFSSSSDQQQHYEDLRCEFDAPCYYDFTRPETSFEAQEAERWFDFAATYPPSPFRPKLKFGNNGIYILGDEKISTLMNDHEHVINSICMDTDNYNRAESVASTSYNDGVEETRKVGKEKSHATAARNSSTLMKPTASYLAKQRKKPLDINHSRKLLLRHRKSHAKYEKINSARSSISHIAAKRPKLEAAGYNMHKVESTCNTIRHNKVTIPREPILETSLRAQRRRSKNSDESVVSNKSILHSSSKAPRH